MAKKELGSKIVLGFGWTVLCLGIAFFIYAIAINHFL